MKIALADDGLFCDGARARTRPLDGRARAVIALAEALASRGHEVTVLGRMDRESRCFGVTWAPLPARDAATNANGATALPPALVEADGLIAVGRPDLLALAPTARARVLWPMEGPEVFATDAGQRLIARFRPAIAYLGLTQYNASPLSGGTVSAPGSRPVFFPPEVPCDPPSPCAIVTTHPLNGLDWLLDLWSGLIHRAAPTARLEIYSALLWRAVAENEPMPAALEPLADMIRGLAAKNVSVCKPLPDADMAEVYRRASVHLYPGCVGDMACWSLIDSQACGLPAVARPLGAVGDRLVNGETGYLVPDATAFANLAIECLAGSALRRSLAEQAARPERRRAWETVADTMARLLV